MIWKDRQFIVMVVGGPNSRTDYHVNEGEEFFYQIEGDMVLKIVDDKGEFRDVNIKEGEIFLLPANTPHSPQRFENTVGLVVEIERPKGQLDTLQWYCEKCSELVYKEKFHLTNIETQFAGIFSRYYGKDKNRTCKSCQHINPTKN